MRNGCSFPFLHTGQHTPGQVFSRLSGFLAPIIALILAILALQCPLAKKPKRIRVHAGKGGKDRVVPLPQRLQKDLQHHIDGVIALHASDLKEGYGEVYLPNALARKYKNAPRETAWQYVFPAKNRSEDPRSGAIRRHHLLPSGLQKAVKRALTQSKIYKKASCHTLRHSFATHSIGKWG